MLSELVGGSYIIHEGDDCNGLYVLIRGNVSGHIFDQGKNVDLELNYKSGQIFGEISYFMST
jgi:CRP-like cAMP-binding protein